MAVNGLMCYLPGDLPFFFFLRNSQKCSNVSDKIKKKSQNLEIFTQGSASEGLIFG